MENRNQSQPNHSQVQDRDHQCHPVQISSKCGQGGRGSKNLKIVRTSFQYVSWLNPLVDDHSFNEEDAGPTIELAELLNRCDSVNTDPDPGSRIARDETESE